jgi:hypothetical protein
MANFGTHQILDKTFKCMSCGADIKLQRKDDDSGWNRYNLDGTPHVDVKKKKQQVQRSQEPPRQQVAGETRAVPQTSTLSVDHVVASLAQEVSVLSNKIDGLQKEIQSISAAIKELQAKNGTHK